ncbi:helix-turn-helix transcriptional regulator [Ruminococcaceae bacterium OttesenSCG-928-D13]|nr:helix-turn-helix transcriptional regulator [Ruminococcaceae bacterium OttesenSCG-928-D13]
MASQFSRVITLLRKERGITQKKAAEELGVSQALLSHYEKGIRECGLDFVVRVANYYDVSCDYLLGRSAERSGLTLSVEEIPAPEATAGKDGHYRGSVLPTLNRKLVSNSLNILYDKLSACPDKGLVTEVSGYLMVSVYKMFRLVYRSVRGNTDSLFSVPGALWQGYSSAAMEMAEANVSAILKGEDIGKGAPLKDLSAFAMTSESLARDYPLYATSLLNLIKTSEERIAGPRAAAPADKVAVNK